MVLLDLVDDSILTFGYLIVIELVAHILFMAKLYNPVLENQSCVRC